MSEKNIDVEEEITSHDNPAVDAVAAKLYDFDKQEFDELDEDEKELYRDKAEDIIDIIDELEGARLEGE
ncbi:hypothetical protein KJ934_00265 [Patescibacteria group bacterium]|nr:hypothetical protein [Patescibacteria group bacterium]MBU4353374.1 hypothetical protein [Patescibacteria group bacterium]MBU4477449.1 hypothetical protein [Patescibacteria group bacterium]MCG2699120.1 hypothetical protein [Candidatus Parcubacteria bacterium]